MCKPANFFLLLLVWLYANQRVGTVYFAVKCTQHTIQYIIIDMPIPYLHTSYPTVFNIYRLKCKCASQQIFFYCYWFGSTLTRGWGMYTFFISAIILSTSVSVRLLQSYRINPMLSHSPKCLSFGNLVTIPPLNVHC